LKFLQRLPHVVRKYAAKSVARTTKVPELDAAPSVFDLAKTEEERQIWALWAAPAQDGAPVPGTVRHGA